MHQFFTILRKDFQLEFRSKETIVLLFGNVVALSAILCSGLASAFVEPPVVAKLFPTLLWAVYFFTAALSSSRAFEQEIESRAFEGVVISGASDWAMYLSKVISSGVILFFGFLCAALVISVLTDIDCSAHVLDLAILGILVTWAYNSISTLLVAISSSSKLRGVLLPLLLLPLIFPLFFAGMELTYAIFQTGRIPFDSPWFSLLLGADVVFLVVGLNLYRFVLYE